MKKRDIIILVIMVIIIFLGIITFWIGNKNFRLETQEDITGANYCGEDSECIIRLGIQEDISEANYCGEDSECIIVNFGCPFGCGSFVNKNANIEIIRDKIAKYQNIPCKYNCITPKNPRCINNRCTIPTCKLNKIFDNMPTDCKCPSGSDIRNVLNEEDNSWNYACKQEICEKGNKYESIWNFYDGTWWNECICPAGTTRTKNSYVPVQQRYFFECN